MGFASRGVTSAEILAAIIDDATRFSGANIDAAISSRSTPAEITAAVTAVLTPVFRWDVINDLFKSIQGTWEVKSTASYFLGSSLRNDTGVAVDDNVSLGVFYVPVNGTYTVHLLHMVDTGFGKLHFLIDTVDVAEIDGYAGTGDYNVLSSVSLGTLTAGIRTLRIVISDKNASSSDYGAAIHAVVIMKT